MNIRLQAAPVTGLSVRLNDQPIGHGGAHQGGEHEVHSNHNKAHEDQEIQHHFYLKVVETQRKIKELTEQLKRDPKSTSLQGHIADNKEEMQRLKDFFKTWGSIKLAPYKADAEIARIHLA